MPVIPALGRWRQGGSLGVQGQPGIQSEFRTSLHYIVKHCLINMKGKNIIIIIKLKEKIKEENML